MLLLQMLRVDLILVLFLVFGSNVFGLECKYSDGKLTAVFTIIGIVVALAVIRIVSKIFKKITGMTPKAYRDSLKR